MTTPDSSSSRETSTFLEEDMEAGRRETLVIENEASSLETRARSERDVRVTELEAALSLARSERDARVTELEAARVTPDRETDAALEVAKSERDANLAELQAVRDTLIETEASLETARSERDAKSTELEAARVAHGRETGAALEVAKCVRDANLTKLQAVRDTLIEIEVSLEISSTSSKRDDAKSSTELESVLEILSETADAASEVAKSSERDAKARGHHQHQHHPPPPALRRVTPDFLTYSDVHGEDADDRGSFASSSASSFAPSLPQSLAATSLSSTSSSSLFGKKNEEEETGKIDDYRAFLSYVCHEVRQPFHALQIGIGLASMAVRRMEANLARVSGRPEGLDNGSLFKEDLREAVELMEGDLVRAASDMSSILDDVLLMEKVGQGKLVIEPKDCLIGDFARGIQRATQRFFEAKLINLRLEVDEHLDDALASMDRLRLQQVLTNFLTNASKFTPEHGKVLFKVQQVADTDDASRREAEAEAAGETGKEGRHGRSRGIGTSSMTTAPWERTMMMIRFSVQDSGVGIPKSKQGQLFDPYEQLRSGELQAGGGTGLGLAIAKGLIEAHGGALSLDSSPGEGSEFAFELSLDTLLNRQHAFGQQQQPPPPLLLHLPDPVAVLVVDDDAVCLKLTLRLLKLLNYSTESCPSGEEALRMYDKGHRWGLVLMDGTLRRGMDGPNAIAALAKLGCASTFLGLTGHTEKEAHDKFIAAGASRVLVKPILIPNLKLTLQEYLLH